VTLRVAPGLKEGYTCDFVDEGLAVEDEIGVIEDEKWGLNVHVGVVVVVSDSDGVGVRDKVAVAVTVAVSEGVAEQREAGDGMQNRLEGCHHTIREIPEVRTMN